MNKDYLVAIFSTHNYVLSPYFINQGEEYYCFIKDIEIPNYAGLKKHYLHAEILVNAKYGYIVEFDLENGFVKYYNDIKLLKKAYKKFKKELRYYKEILGYENLRNTSR